MLNGDTFLPPVQFSIGSKRAGPLWPRRASLALARLLLRGTTAPAGPAAAFVAGAIVVNVFADASLANQAAVGAIHQAIGVALFATLAWALWTAWGPRHER